MNNTVKITCKDVSYDFTSFEGYEHIYEAALDSVRSEFYLLKAEEEEEFAEYNKQKEAALAAGEEFELDPEYESEPLYKGEFDPNVPAYKKVIKNIADVYASNFYEIPTTVVIDIESDFNDDVQALKKAIANKYSVPVVNIKDYGEATNKEIMSQMTFDSMISMFNSDDYAKFLDLKSNLEKYSCNNIAMIYSQRPDAVAVKGKGTWFKEYQRPLIVGEQKNGIMIWCPFFKKLKDESEIDAHISRYLKKDSPAYINRKEKFMAELKKNGYAQDIIGYRSVYVYDISQTRPLDKDKDNYDEIVNLRKSLTDDLANAQAVGNAINKVLGKPNQPFKFDDSLATTQNLYNAVYDAADKTLSTAPETITGIKSNTIYEGSVHRMETLIAAYLVCNHIGINCTDKIALELTKYMNTRRFSQKELLEKGRKEIFSTAFERGCCYAQQFNKNFDASMKEIEKSKSKKQVERD